MLYSWVRKIGQTLGVRGLHGWEAAKTNRTTGDHFPNDESRINQDLVADLQTLRSRTLYECKNNSFLAGVIETHKADVVGSEGPSLQVTSDNDRFNREIEDSWQAWWKDPDITGILSGFEMLQQDVGLLWSCGEFLHQITNDPEADSELQLRLQPIHPRRLDDPLGAAMSQDILLGVRRNSYGKPLSYFITDFNVDEGFAPLSYGQKEIPADEIIHGFRQMEPGQVRGYPLAAPSLSVIADLRDYDKTVLRAARMVADMSVMLYAEHPDLVPINVNETVEFEPNVIRTCPPGWKPMQMKAEQPTTQYVEFRTERLREMGRQVNMPLMMVRLDSAKHSYSSARFDGQVYNRGVKTLQSFLSRKKLDRCLAEVIKETAFVRGLRTPDRVTWKWTWPVAPHVDPQKEAQAIETLLALGMISEFDAAAMFGNDYEAVQEAKQRAAEIRQKSPEENSQNEESDDAERNEKLVRAVVEILSAREGREVVEGKLVV